MNTPWPVFVLCRTWLCVIPFLIPTAHAASGPQADERTQFLLRADATKGTLVDVTGRVTLSVTGGEIVNDADWGGPCLKLGAGDKNGITVRDDGKLSFEQGMTLDAWVRFDDPLPVKGATLALKVGSFSWDLQKAKLNTTWMVFPTEEVFTTAPAQFKYYPVGGETINGLANVPLKQWTRLTMAYDESLGVVTTQIDGVTDRVRFRYRGPQPLQRDAKQPLMLLQGFANVRVGAVHLRGGRPRLAAPALDVFANALPFQDKVMLTFDHIDPDLDLPLEVTVVWEKPSGAAETVRKITLASHAREDLLLDAPTWKNSLHTIHVSVTSGGRSVLMKSLRVASVQPGGRVRLHADGTMSRDGRTFFPLLIYHAMPEHFAQMAELGFNTVLNDFCLNRAHFADREGYARDLKVTLDAAVQHRLGIVVSANAAFGKLHTIPVAKDHPALLAWYGDDEPWGDITRLHESYNTIKMLAPDPPVLIVQNNYSRLQDTAPACDIIATDPYPVPNVSLRGVADATLAARRAVADRKPVWTILPQYGAKIPTRAELRCMAWTAIASGANGLGVFAWDERSRDAKSGELKGWFTPEHPEQIEDLRAVLKELRALEHVLIAPAAAKQPPIANLVLHVLLKESVGKRWLVVANDSRREEEGVVTFPNAVTKASPLTEGAPALQIKEGRATLKMPAHGIAVYEVATP